ncbi:MAG TPA: decarboxylating 6-phosphogluconate dehydrogenase [Gammaproteobacteria bacterium]|jgi:6-phosphogluconate dehydrogenase
MQLGMIGLGRMGANMTRRLLSSGHACVVHDADPVSVRALREVGAEPATNLQELVQKLPSPRVLWLMLPAAVVQPTLVELTKLLAPGDMVVDGGNSHYKDSRRRAEELRARGLGFVDVGTSGGIWGLKEGYCLMIGGDAHTVGQLTPIFQALAPGVKAAVRTADRSGEPDTAEQGYLHCGPAGAGHFVKMVHNGIEYGMMQAYAEGFDILRHASSGKQVRAQDAETAPLCGAEHYLYDFKLDEIAELWRRGSVVRSWLLDLSAHALQADPELAEASTHVADSGEGRWTLQAAIDTGTPVPVLSAALYSRFSSRGEGGFANRLLSALRLEFGGHGQKRQG